MAIEAKYEFCGSWQEMGDDITHVEAAAMLADHECQIGGTDIILTRDSANPSVSFRHSVTVRTVVDVVPLRGDA